MPDLPPHRMSPWMSLRRWTVVLSIGVGLLLLFLQPGVSAAEPAILTTSLSQEDEAADPALPPEKIEMDSFHFPVIVNGRLKGNVLLVIVLQLQPDASLDDISLRLPQVRSDFIIEGNQLARRRFRPDLPIDPDVVAYYFQQAANRRLGTDEVRVFVHQAIYQSL